MKADKLILPVLTVFLITNVALSCFLISRSFKAQAQRQETQQIVKRFECILLIQPADRTTDNVEKCR